MKIIADTGNIEGRKKRGNAKYFRQRARETYDEKNIGNGRESHSRIIVKYESIRDIRGTKGGERTTEITYNERDIPRFPTFRRLGRSSWQAVCARLICRCARRRRQPRLRSLSLCFSLFGTNGVSAQFHLHKTLPREFIALEFLVKLLLLRVAVHYLIDKFRH